MSTEEGQKLPTLSDQITPNKENGAQGKNN